jgi:hypothetical protein
MTHTPCHVSLAAQSPAPIRSGRPAVHWHRPLRVGCNRLAELRRTRHDLLELLQPLRLRDAVQAEMLDQRYRRLRLAERECVGLGAALEEPDLQCPLADRVVLAHELVQPTLQEQAVPVLVDVHAA